MRVAVLGDPDNLLWGGVCLREDAHAPPPHNILRDAGFEIESGAPPSAIHGFVLLVSSELDRVDWSLALARRRGFDRLVVLKWQSEIADATIRSLLSGGGLDAERCPIVTAEVEELGDPEWGTQYDALVPESARRLADALRKVALDPVPHPRATNTRLDALFAIIESEGALRVSFPIARGQLARAGVRGTFVDVEPYAEDGERWPICATCSEPMRYVFQVDPQEIDGLYVAFACCPNADLSSPSSLSSVVRHHPTPSATRRRALLPPSTDRVGGRLGYQLVRGPLEFVPRSWRSLPRSARTAFTKTLSGLRGEELYAELCATIAPHEPSDATAGQGFDAPSCVRCRRPLLLLLATSYLAEMTGSYELWACPCSPARPIFRLAKVV